MIYVNICISGLALMGMALYLLLYRKRNFSRNERQKQYRCTAVILIPCMILVILLYERHTGEDNSIRKRLASGETIITQYGYDSTTATQFSFWTVETADSFSIIDGGIPAMADLVRTVIKEHNNHVDNWMIIGLLRTHTQIIWEPLIVSCRMTPSRSQSTICIQWNFH